MGILHYNMSETKLRIKYYDGPNMSTGFYVLKAGEVLDSITVQSDVTDINTALEY